ncbi:MmgE/PrpD family protein [Roseateles sp. SL47]|uniref:MmgE/PrpD family protein n=1 Tax=Roseateles sp. SL47 TaxID=2995138 RepID=UPI00226E6CA3|nr:MmgE/PrpD family protein [Roseateles sp. SL47]WAC71967.1 MmgE/PrpD family protein [Roseateles sp. SL47]
MTQRTDVLQRLTDFVCGPPNAHLDERLLHDAKRLLLNQFKASAEAAQQPDGRHWLARASSLATRRGATGPGSVGLWWSSARSTPRHAAALHRRLLLLLDFGDSHLPTLGQFTSDIVAVLMACAEAEGQSGRHVLLSLAVGLEVAIVCALMGMNRQTIVTTSQQAALCKLRAMPYGAARQRLERALPAACPVGPLQPEALKALDELGWRWRMRDIAMHCRPGPALAQAPLDAVLALRSTAGDREPRRIQIHLSPMAWVSSTFPRAAVPDPPEKGPAPPPPPSSSGPDLRQSLAAAWLLGQFNVEERHAAQLGHPSLTALGDRIEFNIDARHMGLESCTLTTEFLDGSTDHIHIDAFLGARQQPLSDGQLCELFRQAADPLVRPQRSGEILQALWRLDYAADTRQLLGLLREAA